MKGIKVNLETSLSVKVEKAVAETLKLMEEHTGIAKDEMVNTALKRFIATHKDYLPTKHGGLPK